MIRGDAPSDEQREQAALWLAKRAGGSLSAAEAEALKAWLEADPGNRLAFDQMRVVWGQLGAPARRIAEARPAGRSASLPRRGIIAGAFATALAACLAVWVANPGILLALRADIVSGSELVSSFALPDGSIVRLGAGSALDIDFDENTRHVALLRGEAFFEVRGGLPVPFTVEAGGDSIEVVGTRFNVNALDRTTWVTVEEGAVEVAGRLDAGPVLLGAAEGVAVSEGRAGVVEAADLDMALGWMQGRVTVVNVRLDVLASILERHGQGRILVQPTAAGRPVSGTFPTTDVAASVDTAALAAGATVIRATPWLTVVY
jgi:transmembrane sensor